MERQGKRVRVERRWPPCCHCCCYDADCCDRLDGSENLGQGYSRGAGGDISTVRVCIVPPPTKPIVDGIVGCWCALAVQCFACTRF